MVLVGLLLVAAQAAQAWAAWRRDVSLDAPITVRPGTLVSVMLVNGQIYYGNLSNLDARQISLDDVYYVQTAVDPASNQRNNKLVSRQRADWHAPLRMTMLVDKVLMIEQVGPASQLAQLIEQDRKGVPPKSP